MPMNACPARCAALPACLPAWQPGSPLHPGGRNCAAEVHPHSADVHPDHIGAPTLPRCTHIAGAQPPPGPALLCTTAGGGATPEARHPSVLGGDGDPAQWCAAEAAAAAVFGGRCGCFGAALLLIWGADAAVLGALCVCLWVLVLLC